MEYTSNEERMSHADICKLWETSVQVAESRNIDLFLTLDSFQLAGIDFDDIHNLHKALMVLNQHIEANDDDGADEE